MFLQDLALDGVGQIYANSMAELSALYLISFIISIGLYIWSGFAFMAIARKANLSSPGISWIPGIGPLIIAFKASKMHWWPWLLLIGWIIPFVNFIAIIIFMVFSVIWFWKMFEVVGKPGWWILPTVILTIIGDILVFLGMFSTIAEFSTNGTLSLNSLFIIGQVVAYIGAIIFMILVTIAGKKK